MKILLVEDDEEKRQQLSLFMQEEFGAQVTEARSRQSGVGALLRDQYDLIILDMTMPTYDVTPTEDGGRSQAYAGRDILQQMERRGIHTKAVVVTQFDRFGPAEDEVTLPVLDAQLEAAFPDTYVGAIYYNVGYAGWRENLRSVVQQAGFRE
ncbi:response regulator [Hymenobacter sp. M29]|uniref:Response regulator n=1 Tax=Hymenobacter mellowenesis TaxID=3063995 RepID=A0ABT9AHE1_9BACT|nr:response regulator [Hymenobacter sp. M29]MDO7848525.1 response regulator [Hymenobacter sp. M29]